MTVCQPCLVIEQPHNLGTHTQGELQMSGAKVETHILVFLLASTQRIIRDSASGDADKLVPELLDLVKCGKCFRLSGCTVACRFLLTQVYGLCDTVLFVTLLMADQLIWADTACNTAHLWCSYTYSVPCSSEARAHTILCRLQQKHSERKAHHAIDGMEKAAHSELSFAAVSAVKRSFPPLPPSNIPVFEPPPGYVSVAGLQSKRSAHSQTLRPGAAVSPASGCTGNIYMPQPVQPGISTRRRLRQRPTV